MSITELDTLRHTTSHIMSFAVKTLYPHVQMGVGPWTNDGYYQDYNTGDIRISEDDFNKIEALMKDIIKADYKVVREIISTDMAYKIFGNDTYKKELIDEFIARNDDLTVYHFTDKDGNNVYTDLCAGPHIASTGGVKAFKLMKVAGSYWRGDEKNDTLTRLYGTAFENKEALNDYLIFLEEAQKRDHRRLGQELQLFAFSDLVGSGLPLFLPKGTFMRNKIESVIGKISDKYGYQKVCIPHITKCELYKTSGHWDKFHNDLFHVKGKYDNEYVMKPMNCPHHAQVFAAFPRSYKELPLRFAETTMVYRDEKPGELLGLSRVLSITQDDAHLFCRIEQVLLEAQNIVKIIKEFYTKLDMFKDGHYYVSLSVRDKSDKDSYLGDESMWDKAEMYLEEVCKNEGLHYKRVEGEAAFYGPKLDFMFFDALKRERQLGTIQIDFVQPERFELEFTNEKGEKERPVMIHRAIAGSLERFMAVMIEHFAGAFPLWLAPIQGYILPVNDVHMDTANTLLDTLKQHNYRFEMMPPTDTLGKRIRTAQTQKAPLSIIIGDKEVSTNTLTMRKYGDKEDSTITIDELLTMLLDAEK